MQLLANNARALLVGSILAVDTALTVEAGKADLFPIGTTSNWLAPVNWFKATIEDSSGNMEIVYAGTRGAGSAVITYLLRGQDGTTARAFAAGSVVEVRFTKADAEAGVNALLTSLQRSGGTMTGTLALAGDAANALEAVPKQQLDATAAALVAAIAAAAATAAGTAAANAVIAANAAAAAATPISAVQAFARSTAPTGWVKANGSTIGSAASGAVLRANSDTANLFAALWGEFSNTLLPIQNSAGAPSTRGASAAADYAADKRLPVPDFRGEFIRGLDDGRGVDAARVLGSAQADDLKAHAHPAYGPVATSTFGGSNYDVSAALSSSTGSTGGTETRPRNIAMLICIKL